MHRDGTIDYLGSPEKWDGTGKDISMAADPNDLDEKPPMSFMQGRPGMPGGGMMLGRPGMMRGPSGMMGGKGGIRPGGGPLSPMSPMSPMSTMAGPAASSAETVKRQSGDWGVWVYYAKAIHSLPLILALGFVIISVFCSGFPSEFP
jgi:hypothetical protein